MLRVKCALFEARIPGKTGKVVRRMEMLKAAGSRKVVGTKQALRALKAGTAARVYVCSDADTFIYQQVVREAEEAGVPCVRATSMKELGMICGVDVPTAAAALLR